jgi:hypothetical protein
MTYSEIYKILSFWRNKINYNKIIMITQNNWIIVTDSVKQCGAQTYNINNNL